MLLCTDVTEAVIDEAIRRDCQLILSHHPLLFHPLSTIQGLTFQERVAEKAIRHNIAIYSSHTPMDVYRHGVSAQMAWQLGVTDFQPLTPEGYGVIGNLPKPLRPEELLRRVKERFLPAAIRYTRPCRRDNHPGRFRRRRLRRVPGDGYLPRSRGVPEFRLPPSRVPPGRRSNHDPRYRTLRVRAVYQANLSQFTRRSSVTALYRRGRPLPRPRPYITFRTAPPIVRALRDKNLSNLSNFSH